MKYPCKDCLVDPMCVIGCIPLYSYIQFLDEPSETSIPEKAISTKNRIDRLIAKGTSSNISMKLFMQLVYIKDEKYGTRKKAEISGWIK